MKANNFISKKEHRLLLIIAFTAFLFVFSIFTLQVVKDYNYSVSEDQRQLKFKLTAHLALDFQAIIMCCRDSIF